MAFWQIKKYKTKNYKGKSKWEIAFVRTVRRVKLNKNK